MLFLTACQENFELFKPRDVVDFGKPLYGTWKGEGNNTVAAPSIKCESVEVSIEPVDNAQILKLKQGSGVCNGIAFTIPERIFRIKDGLVFENDKKVGLSQKYSVNEDYSEDGRWFSFPLEFSGFSNDSLYASAQVFLYDNKKYSPSLFFDISTNVDGSGRLIVMLLRLAK
jgi:hypothetical protein